MHTATFPRIELADAAALAARIVEPGNSIPILACAALRESAGAAVIEATDLDIWARVTVPGAKATKNFSVALPARPLRDMLKVPAAQRKSLTLADVAIVPHEIEPGRIHADQSRAPDSQRAAVIMGGARSEMIGRPAADMPDAEFRGMPSADFTLSRAVLAKTIAETRHAISTEETRYYLNGLYMHAPTNSGEPCGVRLVTCDGHRLAIRNIAMPIEAGEWRDMPGVIIPTKAVDFLAAALARKGAPDAVRITIAKGGRDYTSTRVRFVSGNVEVLTKVIDGTYPDYQRSIPSTNDKRARMDRTLFLDALRAVASIRSERGPAVKLSFEAGRLTLTSTNPDTGNATASLEIDYDGAPLDIGFNARYLADELGAWGAETFVMRLQDGGAPAVVRGEDAPDGDKGVLMPMRL